MADINVTPFVDVMLVLLVVFMATAPLLIIGFEVDLPQGEARPLPESGKPVAVTVDRNGNAWIGRQEYTTDALATAILAMRAANPQLRVYLRGDGKARYGQIMRVMEAVTHAGVENIALVTESRRR